LDGSVTIVPSGTNLSGYKVYGLNAFNSVLMPQEGANMDQTEIQEVYYTGWAGSQMVFRNCWIQNINNVNGVIFNSMVAGDIYLGSGQPPALLGAWGDSEKYGTPHLHLGPCDSLIVRGFRGDLKISDKQLDVPVSIDINGELTIDDTCAAGTITVGGVGRWKNKDTYSGGSTIIDNFPTDVNIVRVSGVPVTVQDLQGEAGNITTEGIWQYADRSLTDPVTVSGVQDANIIQVSGEPVNINSFSSSLTTNQIADAVWDSVMDSGFSAEETMKIILASLAGKLSGAAGTTIRIRDVNDTKDRIVATVDSDGNRLSVTLDGS
jgi:hypothetical protein